MHDLCLGATGSTHAFDWKPCQDASTASHYADIDNVSLKPEEPAAGDTVHFAISGKSKIDVSAGTLQQDPTNIYKLLMTHGSAMPECLREGYIMWHQYVTQEPLTLLSCTAVFLSIQKHATCATWLAAPSRQGISALPTTSIYRPLCHRYALPRSVPIGSDAACNLRCHELRACQEPLLACGLRRRRTSSLYMNVQQMPAAKLWFCMHHLRMPRACQDRVVCVCFVCLCVDNQHQLSRERLPDCEIYMYYNPCLAIGTNQSTVVKSDWAILRHHLSCFHSDRDPT